MKSDPFDAARKTLAATQEQLAAMDQAFGEDVQRVVKEARTAMAAERLYQDIGEMRRRHDLSRAYLVDLIHYLRERLPPRMIVRSDGILERVDPRTVIEATSEEELKCGA